MSNSDGFNVQNNTFEEAGQYVILVLSEQFYVLQKVLALRLDSLFKFEDYKRKQEVDRNKELYEDKLSKIEDQLEKLKIEREEEQNTQNKKIEELKEQVYTAKLEREYMQNDLRNSRNFAQKLKE